MNTPTNAYLTKFSSGTILAILALSGLLLFLPLGSPIFASNANLPTATVTGNNPVAGGAVGQNFVITLGNPNPNAYTITGFSINGPSGWTITGCTAGGFLVTCHFTSSAATFSVSQFTVGTAAGVPPGSTDTLTITATVGTASGTYPFTSTFTSKVQDASAVDFYNGPPFSVLVVDSTTHITVVTPAASANYAAGSPALTETATVACTVSATCPSGHEAGIPIVFTAPGYLAGTVFSFSPGTASTDSSGVATTVFQPSNHAGDATTVSAAIGSSAFASVASVGTITTVAGAPTEIAWTLTSSNPKNGNHYITTQGTTVNGVSATFTGATMAATGASFAIADKFGNGVDFSTATLTYTVSLTALSGGGRFDATGLPSVISCKNGGNWQAGGVDIANPAVTPCPVAGTSANLPFPYFQSSLYGAIGEFSASVTGTLNSASYAGAGQSNLLITSTFAGASPVPTIALITGVTLPNVPAGKSVNVTATLATAQAGVPVTLFLDKTTSYETVAGAKDYGANSMLTAGFSGGLFRVSTTTRSNGLAAAMFTIDTNAGSAAFYQANVTAPTDASLTNSLGISADSAGAASLCAAAVVTVCTIAGSPTTFTVLTYYDNLLAFPASHAATSGTLYVNVVISDAYGNVATNTAATAIQIGLTASCGSTCLLSATTVYITSGGKDTQSSFGPITWTMPSGTGSVTLTASGVLSGVQKTSAPATVAVVSPKPTLAITSPVPMSGVIYSGSGNVVFSGGANASIGYASTGPLAVTITSITYKIDTGAVQTAPISSANKITFSVAATMAAGKHTITFNATDSKGNVATGQSYTVLVDTAAPTVKFTTANNANISGTSSSTVTATIVVAQGDLNMSSVVASVNGTALTSSHVTVSGTNTLGTSTTYTVTIGGLSTGTDVLGLSASSLAGLTGTATGITVHVTVAAGQSFVVSGTPSAGKLGQYNGVNVAYQNLNPTTQTIVIFAVWQTSAGTVGISTSSATVGAGATTSAFIVEPVGLASGTYTVNIFVWTTSNQPVSVTTTITVTV